MATGMLNGAWLRARGSSKRTVARLVRRLLPERTVVLKHVEPGLHLRVNLRRNVMFWSGGLARFEPATVAVLRAAIQPGDTVLDIGANIGFFTTLFSRWVGSSGAVLAFEPEPSNQVLLRANVDLNESANVQVMNCAVGDVPGRAVFSIDGSTGATGHLGEGATAGEVAVGTGEVRLVEVPVETIDAVVERDGIVPQVIKLDIEGGEINALQGGYSTLERHHPIVVAELGGDHGGEVLVLLNELGYELWDLEQGRVLAPGQVPFMVVALPRVRRDRERRVITALEQQAVVVHP